MLLFFSACAAINEDSGKGRGVMNTVIAGAVVGGALWIGGRTLD